MLLQRIDDASKTHAHPESLQARKQKFLTEFVQCEKDFQQARGEKQAEVEKLAMGILKRYEVEMTERTEHSTKSIEDVFREWGVLMPKWSIRRLIRKGGQEIIWMKDVDETWRTNGTEVFLDVVRPGFKTSFRAWKQGRRIHVAGTGFQISGPDGTQEQSDSAPQQTRESLMRSRAARRPFQRVPKKAGERLYSPEAIETLRHWNRKFRLSRPERDTRPRIQRYTQPMERAEQPTRTQVPEETSSPEVQNVAEPITVRTIIERLRRNHVWNTKELGVAATELVRQMRKEQTSGTLRLDSPVLSSAKALYALQKRGDVDTSPGDWPSRYHSTLDLIVRAYEPRTATPSSAYRPQPRRASPSPSAASSKAATPLRTTPSKPSRASRRATSPSHSSAKGETERSEGYDDAFLKDIFGTLKFGMSLATEKQTKTTRVYPLREVNSVEWKAMAQVLSNADQLKSAWLACAQSPMSQESNKALVEVLQSTSDELWEKKNLSATMIAARDALHRMYRFTYERYVRIKVGARSVSDDSYKTKPFTPRRVPQRSPRIWDVAPKRKTKREPLASWIDQADSTRGFKQLKTILDARGLRSSDTAAAVKYLYDRRLDRRAEVLARKLNSQLEHGSALALGRGRKEQLQAQLQEIVGQREKRIEKMYNDVTNAWSSVCRSIAGGAIEHVTTDVKRTELQQNKYVADLEATLPILYRGKEVCSYNFRVYIKRETEEVQISMYIPTGSSFLTIRRKAPSVNIANAQSMPDEIQEHVKRVLALQEGEKSFQAHLVCNMAGAILQERGREHVAIRPNEYMSSLNGISAVYRAPEKRRKHHRVEVTWDKDRSCIVRGNAFHDPGKGIPLTAEGLAEEVDWEFFPEIKRDEIAQERAEHLEYLLRETKNALDTYYPHHGLKLEHTSGYGYSYNERTDHIDYVDVVLHGEKKTTPKELTDALIASKHLEEARAVWMLREGVQKALAETYPDDACEVRLWSAGMTATRSEYKSTHLTWEWDAEKHQHIMDGKPVLVQQVAEHIAKTFLFESKEDHAVAVRIARDFHAQLEEKYSKIGYQVTIEDSAITMRDTKDPKNEDRSVRIGYSFGTYLYRGDKKRMYPKDTKEELLKKVDDVLSWGRWSEMKNRTRILEVAPKLDDVRDQFIKLYPSSIYGRIFTTDPETGSLRVQTADGKVWMTTVSPKQLPTDDYTPARRYSRYSPWWQHQGDGETLTAEQDEMREQLSVRIADTLTALKREYPEGKVELEYSDKEMDGQDYVLTVKHNRYGSMQKSFYIVLSKGIRGEWYVSSLFEGSSFNDTHVNHANRDSVKGTLGVGKAREYVGKSATSDNLAHIIGKSEGFRTAEQIQIRNAEITKANEYAREVAVALERKGCTCTVDERELTVRIRKLQMNVILDYSSTSNLYSIHFSSDGKLPWVKTKQQLIDYCAEVLDVDFVPTAETNKRDAEMHKYLDGIGVLREGDTVEHGEVLCIRYASERLERELQVQGDKHEWRYEVGYRDGVFAVPGFDRFNRSTRSFYTDAIRANKKPLPNIPEGIRSVGALCLYGNDEITALPSTLRNIGTLECIDCKNLTTLPDNLIIEEDIELHANNLRALPKNLRCKKGLDVSSDTLERIQSGLYVDGSCYLRCPRLGDISPGSHFDFDLSIISEELTALPATCHYGGSIDLGGCSKLTTLPSLTVRGSLDVRDCTSLPSLPAGLKVYGDLFIGGCTALKELPDDLFVNGEILIEDGQTVKVPEKLKDKVKVWGSI